MRRFNTWFATDDTRIHYCPVCKKTEICKEEHCDFREAFGRHGYCMVTKPTDELAAFLAKNYDALPKDMTGYQKARELSSMVNDVYVTDPTDESHIRACITDLLFEKGEWTK